MLSKDKYDVAMYISIRKNIIWYCHDDDDIIKNKYEFLWTSNIIYSYITNYLAL
jgi:hypothetical protein